MKLYLSRFVCLSAEANLERMEVEARQASEAGAELCVFPEGFLHGYSQVLDPKEARRRFASVSSKYPQTAFLFGSFSEDRRNRMTLWFGGEERASYDKVHLFGPNNEAALWDRGDQYVAAKMGEWTLGFVNCNDIRFPEQARALRVQAKCDAIVAVAWWPWRRDHIWRALLRARAIENGVFTIGCCISASRFPGENFEGAGNHVFDPIGDPVPTRDDHTYILDRKRFDGVLVDPLNAYIEINKVEIK